AKAKAKSRLSNSPAGLVAKAIGVRKTGNVARRSWVRIPHLPPIFPVLLAFPQGFDGNPPKKPPFPK
ncbi:MAG: hypothetical protein ACYCWA_04805, partial [Thiobacillus sp.]